MASKKDLVEGQAFSRRRLITAFVSGAPSGREVEPGKPLRAVVGGVVLSVLLVVGALAVGLLSPTLPSGWDDNSLVIAKDSGARYVALKQTLYPVINTSSARLLIPSNFKVVSAPDDRLTSSKRGATVGIIGAPDALPAPSDLVTTGWASCVNDRGGLLTRVSHTSKAARATDQAIVVAVDDTAYLIDNGYRYELPPGDAGITILRAVGLDAAPVKVGATWLNLFAPGPALGPVDIPGAGEDLQNLPDLTALQIHVGSIVTGGDTRRYVVQRGGTVAQLSDFAFALYKLGSGAANNAVFTLSLNQLGALPTGPTAVPTQWPSRLPTPLPDTPCALLSSGTGETTPTVSLASTSSIRPEDKATTTDIDPGAGALVRAVGAASLDKGAIVLIDQTGTAFPVTGTTEEAPVTRLGYSASDIVPVPQAWIELFKAGPTLSYSAADKTVAATTAPGK